MAPAKPLSNLAQMLSALTVVTVEIAAVALVCGAVYGPLFAVLRASPVPGARHEWRAVARVKARGLLLVLALAMAVGVLSATSATTVLVLGSLGFNPLPFLAGAGLLAGLVIGFGAQSLINDVVSGFFILFENIYLVGDIIEVGPAPGASSRRFEFRTTTYPRRRRPRARHPQRRHEAGHQLFEGLRRGGRRRGSPLRRRPAARARALCAQAGRAPAPRRAATCWPTRRSTASRRSARRR